MKDDILANLLYEYFDRRVTEMESAYNKLSRQALQKMDTVDIIDYIEYRAKMEVAIEFQQSVAFIIKWSRKYR